MFKNNTYMTRGVEATLSIKLISLLWLKVQEVIDRELDYLQIFEFRNVGTPDKPSLEVKWSQEQPKHTELFFIKGEQTDVDKVWIICAGEGSREEYSTMLLPEEY